MGRLGKLSVFLVATSVLVILIGGFVLESSAEPVNGQRVIILYKNDVSENDMDELKAINAKMLRKFNIIPAVAAFVDEKRIGEIKSNKNVVDVFEDTPVHATLSQSVPQIDANQAHAVGVTGAGVRVCVLDTGIDDSHSALNPLVDEKDFVNNDDDGTDDQGHGTHVAGIIGSKDAGNGGVAPGSMLMSGKVLDNTGSGFSSWVISGIDWCVLFDADVINLSLGATRFSSPCDSRPMAMAANNAVAQGVVVVASSGNDNSPNKVDDPACGSNVMAIGATDDNDNSVGFSNRGALLDVVAPGVGILSTQIGGGFTQKTGTSMAAPHVTGTAALILQAFPGLTPAEVRTIIRDNAVDLGNPGFDTTFGYGRVDAFAFLPEDDTDGDGIIDVVDNCVNDSNPDQLDMNVNGIGDVCDTLCGQPYSFYTNVIVGDDTSEMLIGTGDADLIGAFGGNDFILGKGGNDCIFAGYGNDWVIGNRGDDEIHGQDGDDSIWGGKDNDRLFGEKGNDMINGHVGVDEIYGGEDDDILFVGAGNDFVDGGEGIDICFDNNFPATMINCEIT